MQYIKEQEISSILTYFPLKGEPDIISFNKFLFHQYKKIYFPKVIHDQLIFYASTAKQTFFISSFKVLEPSSLNPIYNPEKSEFDVAFVPGLGFDFNGNRLGFGKGYYDKFLSDFKGKKVGVCLETNLIQNIPVEDSDIKMDFIVTEKRTLSFL